MTTQPLVGHVLEMADGRRGKHGSAYNFVFAGNGRFIEVTNDTRMVVTVPVVDCFTPGLPELQPHFRLRYGKIPAELWELAVNQMYAHRQAEWMVAIVWNGEDYQLVEPSQQVTGASVTYDPTLTQGASFEMHSHVNMAAQFSSTDDRDERALRVYGVIGRLDNEQPEFQFRVGAYGSFMPVKWTEVFEPGVNMPGGYAGKEIEPDHATPLMQAIEYSLKLKRLHDSAADLLEAVGDLMGEGEDEHDDSDSD